MANPFDALDTDVAGGAVKGAAAAGAGGSTGANPFDAVLSTAQDPNSLHIDFGGGYGTDVQVPWGLQNIAWGAAALDRNLMGPLARGITKYGGLLADSVYTGVMAPEQSPFGKSAAYVDNLLGIDPAPPDAGFGNAVLEATGGGLAGGGIANLAEGVGTAAPTILREAATGLTSVLGQYGGGYVGEQLGGQRGREIGETLGSIAGGAATPAVTATVVKPAARLAFSKGGPNAADGRTPSRVAYDNLIATGITPRPGLVGNPSVARLENTMAGVPIAGNIPQRRIDNNFREFQQAVYDAAYGIAGRPTPVPPNMQVPAGEGALGGQMRVAADVGLDNLNRELGNNYDGFYGTVPQGTLVEPHNMRAEVERANNPFTGEDPEVTTAVNTFYNDKIPTTTVYPQGPARPGAPARNGYGPTVPDGAPLTPGVPFNRFAKVQSSAFRDAQGNGMEGGAIEQIRQGGKQDQYDALLSDPQMVSRFPDPMDRMAQVERLRVLNTEYAMAREKGVSRVGAKNIGGRYYVGGDIPTLESIKNPPTDETSFGRGSRPDGMAVLQRNMPARGTNSNLGDTTYGDLAASTIIENAQSNKPRGDVNISPDVFTRWWQSLDDNAKLLYTNEGYTPGRSFPADNMPIAPGGTPHMNNMDRLGQVGELFRDAGAQANPSGTAPTLATLAMASQAFTNPLTMAGIAGSNALIGSLISSPEMARAIAGVGPSKWAEVGRGLFNALPATAVNTSQPYEEPLL